MPNTTELTIPTNYTACVGCTSRLTQKNLAIKYFEATQKNVAENPKDGEDGENINYDLELSYTCLPQLRKLAHMSIQAKQYILDSTGEKPIRRKKPDERKTFTQTVSCDAQVAGEPLV